MESAEMPQAGWVSPRDWVRALRALGGVIRNPDRTDLIGEFISSVSGSSGMRLYADVMSDPEARAILMEGRDLKATLSDRESLAAMPVGSLGRTYFEWTERRDFDAEGIADAISKQVPRDLDGPVATLAARVVDQHDLWHVLNGWDSDVHGEVHLLGFSYAQLGGRGWWILGRLAVFFLASAGRKDSAGYFRHAMARGRDARMLAGVEWEAMLPRPLEEVRRSLGIDAPVPYEKLDRADVERLRGESPVLRFLNHVLGAQGQAG